MPHYMISFNAGDMVIPDADLPAVGRDAQAVVQAAQAAGVYVFAAGVEENGPIYTADPTQGDEVAVTDGAYVDQPDHLGGFAIVRVDDDEAAKYWAAKVAEGCGWPQEVRRVW